MLMDYEFEITKTAIPSVNIVELHLVPHKLSINSDPYLLGSWCVSSDLIYGPNSEDYFDHLLKESLEKL
jgi:hypothetical protein